MHPFLFSLSVSRPFSPFPFFPSVSIMHIYSSQNGIERILLLLVLLLLLLLLILLLLHTHKKTWKTPSTANWYEAPVEVLRTFEWMLQMFNGFCFFYSAIPVGQSGRWCGRIHALLYIYKFHECGLRSVLFSWATTIAKNKISQKEKKKKQNWRWKERK